MPSSTYYRNCACAFRAMRRRARRADAARARRATTTRARRSIASLGLWRGSERCDARARGRCAGGRCDGVGRWKHLRSRVRGRRTGRGALGGGEGGDVRATTRVAWGFRRRGRTRRRRRDGDVERRASARGNERLTVICIFVRAQTGRRSRSRDVRSRRNVWMPS